MAWTTPRTWTDGELVTAAIMNAHVRDQFNVIGARFHLRKTADQSDSSSTLTNVTNLSFAIAASEVWSVTLELAIAATAIADFKYAWTVPAGCTGHWWDTGFLVNVVTGHGQSTIATTLTHGFGSDGEGMLHTQATIINSTTAGTAQLQFAANAASASATVRANSVLIAERIA